MPTSGRGQPPECVDYDIKNTQSETDDLYSIRSAFLHVEVTEQQLVTAEALLQNHRAQYMNFRDPVLARKHANYIDLGIRGIVWILHHREYTAQLHRQVIGMVGSLRSLLFDLELFLYSDAFLGGIAKELEHDNPKVANLSDAEQNFIAKNIGVASDARQSVFDLTYKELNDKEKDYVLRVRAYNALHGCLDVRTLDYSLTNEHTFSQKKIAVKMVVMHAMLDYLGNNIHDNTFDNIKNLIQFGDSRYKGYDYSFAYYEQALLSLALMVGAYYKIKRSLTSDGSEFDKRIQTLSSLVYAQLNHKFAIIDSRSELTEILSATDVATYSHIAHNLLRQAVNYLLNAKPFENKEVMRVLRFLRCFNELNNNQRFQEVMRHSEEVGNVVATADLVVYETKTISSGSQESVQRLPTMVELPVPVEKATVCDRGVELVMFTPEFGATVQELPTTRCCLPRSSRLGCTIC